VSRAASIRPRRDDDVAVLADLLIEQQPVSRYPYRWPLPFPVEDFLVRDGEQAAWVARGPTWAHRQGNGMADKTRNLYSDVAGA